MPNANWPVSVWQWDPSTGPTDTTRRWRSLTSRVATEDAGGGVYNTSFGRQYELAAQEAGTVGVQVGNLDELLTPANLSSPFQVMAGWQFRQATAVRDSWGFNPNTLQFTQRTLPGSLIVVVTSGNGTCSVQPIPGAKSFTALGTVTAGGYTLTVWGTITDGGDKYLPMIGTGTFTGVALEYIGCGDLANLDVVATATRLAGSYTSVGTGTTAAAQAGDLQIVAAAPCGFAAASAPASPSWGASTQRVAALSPGSGTAANNSLVFVGDTFPTTAGAKTDTASWTGAASNALGLIVTIRQSPTIDLLTPPTGSMALIPYRPIRHWAMWPRTSGNLLNSTNDQWAEWAAVVGAFADTAGFEGGTTGTWWVDRAASIATSTTRAHDGTRSMLVTWPTAGSGAAYVSTDLPPVETGTQYTLSAWVWVPTGSPAVRLQWGLVNGTASSTTNAWQRISVTVTRADAQDDRLYLVTAGASTAGQTVYVDSVQVEIGAAASTFAATGATIYPLHWGFIERFPESWSASGYYGWEQLTSVDPLAALAAVQLQDCLTEDILQDRPAWLVPFDDPERTITSYQEVQDQVSVLTGSSLQRILYLNPLIISCYDSAAGSSVQFGVAGGPGLDSRNCVQFNGPSSGYVQMTARGGGYRYIPPGDFSTSFPDVSLMADTGAGTASEVWFKTATANQTNFAYFADPFGGTGYITYSLTTGRVQVEHFLPSGSVSTVISGGGNWADGAWHQAVLTEVAAAGTVTMTLYVDGQAVATGTRTSSVATSMGQLQVGRSVTGPIQVACCAAYPTALAAARVRSHWAASKGFPWDSGGQRMARILGWMPWGGPTDIPDGITLMGPAAGLSGTSVQDAINTATATENGAFYATPAGVLQFLPRDHYYTAVPTVTFGEDAAAGEVPYESDVSAGADITFVFNEITVTPSSGNEQMATDARSQQWFGRRTHQVNTAHARDADAMLLAQHLLGVFKDPHMRVISLAIDPAANSALWPVALGLRFGDRVLFKRRTSAGLTITIDGFIDRVEHAVGPGTWKTRFQISPADPLPVFILGDATYGVIGQTPIRY